MKKIKYILIPPATTLTVYIVGLWFTFDFDWFYFDIIDDKTRAEFTGLLFLKIICLDFPIIMSLREYYIDKEKSKKFNKS